MSGTQVQILFLFLLLACPIINEAQVLTEPFDDDSQFTKSHSFFTDGNDDYFGIYDPLGASNDFDGDPVVGGIPNFTGNTGLFLIGEDLDSGGDPGTQTLTWTGLNITGLTNLSLAVDLAVDPGGFDNTDEIAFAVNIDGAGYTTIIQFNGDMTFNGVATNGSINLGLALQTVTSSIIGTGTSLDLQLTVTADSGNEEFAIDNISLTGVPLGSCPHTITGYTPSSGPVGTEVTIDGTGFTSSTTISFNGIPATEVTFVNAVEIIATVPNTATSGTITLTESACDEDAMPDFTVTDISGTCSNVLSDLIISEIYDSNGGSLGYIEIYNGTGMTIDLSDYQIDRYGDLTTMTVSHSYTFPAISIAPGEVLVGKVSNDPDATGFTPDFQFGGSTSGFNEDDRLELVYIPTGAVIDDWHDFAVLGANGFSYLRDPNITAPNPTYTATEWSGFATESTTDLGNFMQPATLSISVQPIDNPCALNFSVSAMAGNGGTLTYQWFFHPNDGSTSTWTSVSAAAFPSSTVTGSTSDELSITGNLAPYDNYQFYCQVTEDASCNKASDAAQFTYAPLVFFR